MGQVCEWYMARTSKSEHLLRQLCTPQQQRQCGLVDERIGEHGTAVLWRAAAVLGPGDGKLVQSDVRMWVEEWVHCGGVAVGRSMPISDERDGMQCGEWSGAAGSVGWGRDCRGMYVDCWILSGCG